MYFHHQSLSRPINNSHVPVAPATPASKKLDKVPTKEEWRYENITRMSKGQDALSYEEFVRQVKAGMIHI